MRALALIGLTLGLSAFEPAVAGDGSGAVPRPPPGWRPFAAVYDGNAPVKLTGPITGVEWTRPRVLVHMVDTASGQAWAIEGGDPEVMAKGGLPREAFAKGAVVVVRGYQAKNKACAPECLANGRDLTFADGRKVFVGGGAPAR